MRFPIGSLWRTYAGRLVAALVLMAAIVIVGVVILLAQSCEDGVVPAPSPPPPTLTGSN